MNTGSSSRTIYDTCSYQKYLYESTAPLNYNLFFGKHENCNKCKYDYHWLRYQLVDVESELRNQTRPLSNCDQFKYSPHCYRSGLCMSTFDRKVPIVPAPEICPIIYNNIQKHTHPGYELPDAQFCGAEASRKMRPKRMMQPRRTMQPGRMMQPRMVQPGRMMQSYASY
uniref:Uncharacterized protein n=1 Tax=Mimivirus LCMiAC01 TaxID=2506608 RepID=A0A481YYP2_9VIRU|nr:MAG: uncharacterized protein LCMiAC01_00370 [Mimivirus LCMiAC01]